MRIELGTEFRFALKFGTYALAGVAPRHPERSRRVSHFEMLRYTQHDVALFPEKNQSLRPAVQIPGGGLIPKD